MTKTPIILQELRQRIYQKAKAEPTHRFWGLFTHITKMTTLKEAYQHAKKNGGAAGIDGQSFADEEQEGVTPFLKSIQEELRTGTYQPQANRKVDIPKANGKMRTLQIPTIRDRVAKDMVKRINAVLAGWVNYFRVGNSSRAFIEVRDYTEMKIRTLLTRRKRRGKRSVGWRRWSNEYLYNVLGLYWDWKVHPLKNEEGYR